MMNFKNGFNKYMGIFNVFVEGLYLLIWVMCVYCSKLYIIELYVNKSIVGFMFVYCGVDMVIGNVVVQLYKGDVVFVCIFVGRGEIRSNKYG